MYMYMCNTIVVYTFLCWSSSPIGTVRCTAFVLSHRTGGAQESQGHQLAFVAYRDGQLYCICTKS